MKGLTQFEIPAGECGPVFTPRMEPFDCRNGTRHEIPAGHFVAVRAEAGQWVIIKDMGPGNARGT